MIEIGTRLQNRYLVKKQIGAGGMGAVYLAVDERFGNNIALKETFYKDDEFDAAFEREARLLNGLQHSALPHVSDYFTEKGEHFLVMQFIEGEDLSASLKSGKRFPIETVLRWTNELLDALDYLHSQNPPIIHRDIKPQNLKITTRGGIVLLDFGLAKLKSDDSTAQSVFGYSRRYSSLEQIQGVGTDARSDIFSLAATVYSLLTGEPPIDALARAAAIVAGQPDPLKKANELNKEIPSNVADVLQKALALNSADRFESAQAMCDALKHLGSDSANAEPANAVNLGGEKVSEQQNSFPALAAFAAGSKAVSTEKSDTESFPPAVSDHRQVSANLAENELTDVPTRVSLTERRKSSLPLIAAAAILLLCVGLSAAYFINRSNSSASGNQTPDGQVSVPVNETVETNSAGSIAAPDSQTLNLSPAQTSDIKKEIVKNEKPEKAAPTARKEPAKTDQTASDTRRELQTNGETRERVVEAVPSDEDVLNDSADADFRRRQQQRRQNRIRRQQQQRDEPIIEMSEDEWRDYQRRMRRRQQNRGGFPY